MQNKKVVAMLLAGGQGSRLHSLTKEIAKPAVPFGGKYRIIDFPLSNCTNSGIHTVGVLTQYQPLVLNSYIGIGSAWDLDRKEGGVTVLPPYAAANEVKWYSGTASAIYQNLNYLKLHQPDYVLILSGDHIYKMNYEKMLEDHIDKGADATISVIEVPWKEAGRFGIMSVDHERRVMDFMEKPLEPNSNLASMGIYIFNRTVLETALKMDNLDLNSSHDFGKDIIPRLLRENKKVFAYPFNGYWKDVGTVKSLWEANMDLLDDACGLDLFDISWRIYSVNPNQPPQVIGENAFIKESLINEGCVVEGNINRSVVFQGVTIKAGAKVFKSVIMPDAIIGEGCIIEKAIISPGVTVPEGTKIIPAVSDEVVLISQDSINEYLSC
ncbi:glucose-1-phosphate adenylyltransferase [Bacillus massilinigeriensis]|uniref:glucose-1-phosphate adenylyltransferase n=1 Tax=Bacillus mediterraneensis TaxID=1805474 RepID=UPI0008F879EA|nr:glucose-1-phosphate adenylyltransferase [Bacillus mediterraneensis]